MVFKANPPSDFQGLITIIVTYINAADNTKFAYGYFQLEVYPILPLGNTATPTCSKSVWPLTFGTYAPDNFFAYNADVDAAEENVLLCGMLSPTAPTINGAVGGFVTELNMNLVTHFTHTFQNDPTITSAV